MVLKLNQMLIRSQDAWNICHKPSVLAIPSREGRKEATKTANICCSLTRGTDRAKSGKQNLEKTGCNITSGNSTYCVLLFPFHSSCRLGKDGVLQGFFVVRRFYLCDWNSRELRTNMIRDIGYPSSNTCAMLACWHSLWPMATKLGSLV